MLPAIYSEQSPTGRSLIERPTYGWTVVVGGSALNRDTFCR